jgi:hypothetical protein
MRSKRSHEGYLLMDNRVSQGIPDELVVKVGMPVGSGRGMFEAPTYTCSHCCTVVILNPLRNRERAYCRKCDHYICDKCGIALAATGDCHTFKQLVEEIQEAAVKQETQERQGNIILSS